MNLISSNIVQNITTLSNWVDSTATTQFVDSVTYDLYESNNPFRQKFTKEQINNNGLRTAANTTTRIGAEVFSVFANPYYLTHKVTQIPTAYKDVVESYKKFSQKS